MSSHDDSVAVKTYKHVSALEELLDAALEVAEEATIHVANHQFRGELLEELYGLRRKLVEFHHKGYLK